MAGTLVQELASIAPMLHRGKQAISSSITLASNHCMIAQYGGMQSLIAPCRLVECIALARIALSSADEAALLLLINENLCHPASPIQEAAAAALHAMARTHLKGAAAVPVFLPNVENPT